MVLLFCLALVAPVFAENESPPGIEEVSRLLAQHPAQIIVEEDIATLPVYETPLLLDSDSPPVIFKIPGFETFECGKCHQPEDLAKRTAQRLKRTLTSLKKKSFLNKRVPLRQYIIQPYTDKLLQAGQLAHATFDTIRVFPGTVVIDHMVYGGQTHLHEMLHLSQPFLGHVNELEAYGLNVSVDPRFLLLNYPYFSDAVRAYRLPELDQMIRNWYARPVKENLTAPQEVQWYLDPFDDGALNKLSEAIKDFQPVLQEVSALYRTQPAQAAYWSERTGIRSLVFDLAALKVFGLPPIEISPDEMARAMKVFDQQMTKDDNTRLGYVIDRKTESMLTLKYGSGPKDGMKQLAVYFQYLKKTFFNTSGEIEWPMDSSEDFDQFVKRKIEGVETMSQFKGMSLIEKEGAQKIVQELKSNK